MDARAENNRWRSVPEFGGWDHNGDGASSYSVVFTQARADRKQQKTDLTEFKRTSIGTEKELMEMADKRQQKHHRHHRQHHRNEHQHRHHHHHHQHHHHQPPADESVVPLKKKKLLTYINCCIRP